MCTVYKKAQLPPIWSNRIAYIRRPASDFRSQKNSDSPKFHTHYGDASVGLSIIERYNQR